MADDVLWLTPLILLPGVALLVLSTSIRYGRIHDEFHDLEEHEPGRTREILPQLLLRARLFRDALVSLYASATLLALASLLGGMLKAASGSAGWLSAGLSMLAIVAVVVAAGALARECALSLGVFRAHASWLRSDGTD